jgi:threonine aldolase
VIDLRSDTLTLPSIRMRDVMSHAEVGDDCYGEDFSVKELEEYCKELFQVEDAIFVSSGTMANQLAIKTQVEEGNEVITEGNYHISFYESGQTAKLNSVALNCVYTEDGILTVDHVNEAIDLRPRGEFYSKPQMITIENTINFYQGKIFPIEVIKKLREFTYENNLSLHMDGARLFNAHVKTGVSFSDYAKHFDTLCVCFAKGLGAPFGSMLMGKKEIIEKARKYRKWYGGGLHQAGIYAKAAHFALTNNLKDLHQDHLRTQKLVQALSELPQINVSKEKVETNMIFFKTTLLNITSYEFVKKCKEKGLLLFPWSKDTVRIVVHRNVDDYGIANTASIIKEVHNTLTTQVSYV